MNRLSFEYRFENCPSFDELVQFRRDELSVEFTVGIGRHLTWCPRCQKVEALMVESAGEANWDLNVEGSSVVPEAYKETLWRKIAELAALQQSKANVPRKYRKPLMDWVAMPSLVPNLVRGAVSDGRGWTLTVGKKERMTPATLTVKQVNHEGNSKHLLLQSDNVKSIFVIRAFVGGRQIFEERLKGLQSVVTELKEDLPPETVIEIIEFIE